LHQGDGGQRDEALQPDQHRLKDPDGRHEGRENGQKLNQRSEVTVVEEEYA
jgi:hypothetical protein